MRTTQILIATIRCSGYRLVENGGFYKVHSVYYSVVPIHRNTRIDTRNHGASGHEIGKFSN